MSSATISPSDLFARLERGERAAIIDVRTPAEFAEVHAAPARNCPLDALDPARVRQDCAPSGEPVYILCKSGMRATKACAQLGAAGLGGTVVEGGTDAWVAAGLPVVRGGRKTISLERQVRIAAGALVLTGVVLGFAVSPGFFGLSGFVGAGLIFAGVTDTCAMGMLIAKMPWNR